MNIPSILFTITHSYISGWYSLLVEVIENDCNDWEVGGYDIVKTCLLIYINVRIYRYI